MTLGEAQRGSGLGIVVALALTAACGSERQGGSEAATGVADRRGGTVVVAGREPVATLNPLTATDYLPFQLQRHVLFTTLVRYDSAQRIRPYLARSWETNADSSSIVFHLRTDVRWHDGPPTTAEDVALTFRRVKDPAVPFPNRTFFDLWNSVEIVDDSTVRFALTPHAGFLFGWTETAIVPAHRLRSVPPEGLLAHPFGTSEPVGNGPFRFVERRGTDAWIFEANSEFPGALGGRPYADRLVYRVIPDVTTLLSELRTSRVHYYVDVPPAQTGRLETDASTRLVTYPNRVLTFIAWNTRNPPFQEVAERQALSLAIDRRQIVEAVREGLGVVASGPIGPWHWAHDDSWTPLPYAPDSARALLDAAGWRDVDGDSVLERDGQEFRFELLTNDNPVREDIAVIVQEQLGRVGVVARPRVRESASLAATVTGAERAFDAVILAFTQDWVLDDRDQWACDRREGPFHFSGFCDPELDAVLDSIPRARDRETRRQLYRRYHEIVAGPAPYTFLYHDITAAGLRRELHGARPDARGDLVDVGEWWLERRARGDGSP